MKPLASTLTALTSAGAVIGMAAQTTPALADPAPNKADQAAAATSATADSTVATYNGKDIKLSEVDAEIQRKPQFAMLKNYSAGDPQIMNRIRLAATNEIINRQLLLEAAKKSGVIDEKEIQKSVDNLVQQYGGKEKLSPLLKNINTNYDTFTSEVGDDFRINAYIDKDLAKDVKISDADVKKAFDADPTKYSAKESIKVAHILIKVPADASADADKAAKAKIEDIYAKATANGGDFGALAKEFSQDGAAARGGELGVIEKGKTVPAFEDAAFALKPGETSKPVRTEFGYHLIKVTEKMPAEKPDYAKVKPMFEQELLQRAKAKAVEAKLTQLRSTAQIKINIANS
ncbi:MAG: peptidylprolyl isomerase [Deltaproteobacteria bacterium]|nr:peptidylprolyl isomerase [Deltaproteobacteria bacterium]